MLLVYECKTDPTYLITRNNWGNDNNNWGNWGNVPSLYPKKKHDKGLQWKFDKFHFPSQILVSESTFHPSCIVLLHFCMSRNYAPVPPRKNINLRRLYNWFCNLSSERYTIQWLSNPFEPKQTEEGNSGGRIIPYLSLRFLYIGNDPRNDWRFRVFQRMHLKYITQTPMFEFLP